jgi:predicted oxidoreductase
MVEKSIYPGVAGLEDGGYHGKLEGGVVAGCIHEGRDGVLDEKVIPG